MSTPFSQSLGVINPDATYQEDIEAGDIEDIALNLLENGFLYEVTIDDEQGTTEPGQETNLLAAPGVGIIRNSSTADAHTLPVTTDQTQAGFFLLNIDTTLSPEQRGFSIEGTVYFKVENKTNDLAVVLDGQLSSADAGAPPDIEFRLSREAFDLGDDCYALDIPKTAFVVPPGFRWAFSARFKNNSAGANTDNITNVVATPQDSTYSSMTVKSFPVPGSL